MLGIFNIMPKMRTVIELDAHGTVVSKSEVATNRRMTSDHLEWSTVDSIAICPLGLQFSGVHESRWKAKRFQDEMRAIA